MEKRDLIGAEANLREGERLYRKLYDPNNIVIYDNLRLQAQVSYLAGKYPEALATINQVLEKYRQNSNPKYISFATALTVQGLILNKLGRGDEAEKILRWMELLTACLFQALNGEPEVLCQQIHKARGFRGQSLSAKRISDSLRTHPDFAKRIDDHQWGTAAKAVDPGAEIQDPYSLRCAPQILGAFQEAHWHVAEVVTRELNASTDNPLIFPDTEMVIHGGNFYGQQIAMVSDYLRIGLIKVALLAERQTERLVNWRYSRGLPPMLAGGAPGLNSGFSGAQLLSTSLAAELRLLGTAASIQTISTNANNQDVVSMGCIAAKMTRTALPLAWKILAIQTLALAQAADLRAPKNVMGGDYKKLHDLVRAVSPKLENDRPLVEDIQRVTDLLQSEDAQRQFFRE